MSTTFYDSGGNVRLAGVPATQSRLVTTDPDDFYASAVFDIGHPAVVYISATVVALDPDGEPFGQGAGEIAPLVSFASEAFPVSAGLSQDGANYGIYSTAQIILGQPLVAVGEVVQLMLPAPRYLRPVLGILDNDSGDPYAGSNHPTVQVRYDLVYL